MCSFSLFGALFLFAFALTGGSADLSQQKGEISTGTLQAENVGAGRDKRSAWNNFKGSWGKRDSDDQTTEDAINDDLSKRSNWAMHGSWGKRQLGQSPPSQDRLLLLQAMQNSMPNLIGTPDSVGTPDSNDENVYITPYEETYFNEAPPQKRTWVKLFGGQERSPKTVSARSSKWSSLRGSWGKRTPKWSQLRGTWGKRSTQD